MTWTDPVVLIALGGLLCNLILTSLALWRACQAVTAIRQLSKDQATRHNGRFSSFVVPLLILVMLTPALADGPTPSSFDPPRAHTHPPGEDWIQKGGLRNAAGEWCCGEGDCFMIESVRSTAAGYFLPVLNETVPYSEAQPSPDGKFWRCKRPDGTRRCFFAPSPSM